MWNVTVRIGHAFAQIEALELDGAQKSLSHSWYLPKKGLISSLKDFLNKNNIENVKSIFICSKVSQKFFNESIHNKSAFLTTSGFENWAHMNLPTQSRFFSLFPKRVNPPISSDFIFGITERTNDKGESEQEVNLDELEAIAAKLEMNDIECLAIGFLHSNLNPHNEDIAAKFFKQKGFEVFTSYSVSQKNNKNFSESSRWWSAILNSCFYSNLKEYFEDLEEYAKELGADLRVISSTGELLQPQDTKLFSSIFADSFLISKYLKDSEFYQPNTVFVYMGLEDFIIFNFSQEKPDLWQTPLGPVLFPNTNAKKMKIQPTQAIEKNIWGTAGLKYKSVSQLSKSIAKTIGFEPGPICLGRGLKPCLLDLLYFNNQLNEVDQLKALAQEKKKALIGENLLSYSKDQKVKHGFNDKQIADWLTEMVKAEINMELLSQICESENDKLQFLSFGPLSGVLSKMISKKIKHKQIDITDSDIFLHSLKSPQDVSLA